MLAISRIMLWIALDFFVNFWTNFRAVGGQVPAGTSAETVVAKTLDSAAKKLCGANIPEGFWNLGGNWRGWIFSLEVSVFVGRRILVKGWRSSVAAWICAEGGGSLGEDCDLKVWDGSYGDESSGENFLEFNSDVWMIRVWKMVWSSGRLRPLLPCKWSRSRICWCMTVWWFLNRWSGWESEMIIQGFVLFLFFTLLWADKCDRIHLHQEIGCCVSRGLPVSLLSTAIGDGVVKNLDRPRAALTRDMANWSWIPRSGGMWTGILYRMLIRRGQWRSWGFLQVEMVRACLRVSSWWCLV